MKDQLRLEVKSLAQTINKKRSLMFEKLKNEKFEDAAKLRDDIQLKQKEMLDILTTN